MKIHKHPIRPDRLRQIPPGFSWVDHRLVRHNYIQRCDCPALALYLFLVTVADAEGLSYYSEAAICRRLKIDLVGLGAARTGLEEADLIAYRRPLYQVLSLENQPGPSSLPSQRGGQTQSVGQILRRVLEGSEA